MSKCYTGEKSCGCLVAISMNIEDVYIEWRELGYKISVMDLEEAKNKLMKCKHRVKQKQEVEK